MRSDGPPGWIQNRPFAGKVRSAYSREINTRSEGQYIRTDCTIVGGDSGGPLFDMNGRVIGIHSRIGGGITQNMHVPVDTYRDTWKRGWSKASGWGGGIGRPGACLTPVVGEARLSLQARDLSKK